MPHPPPGTATCLMALRDVSHRLGCRWDGTEDEDDDDDEVEREKEQWVGAGT